MSLTSYRAAPPRDPEDTFMMPELFPYASAIVKNVTIYPPHELRQKYCYPGGVGKEALKDTLCHKSGYRGRNG